MICIKEIWLQKKFIIPNVRHILCIIFDIYQRISKIEKQLQMLQSPRKATYNTTPATHSQSSQSRKQFRTVFNPNKIQLTYIANPIKKLYIQIINKQLYKIMQIELSRDVLARMDASVMATFENMQVMYDEFVEIIKAEPQKFCIEGCVLRVGISMAMKSGVKNKELVLEGVLREMTEVEQLRHRLQQKQQETSDNIQKLTQKTQLLQKQLQSVCKQNKELKVQLSQLKKQMKEEVSQIKQKIQKQKQLTTQIMREYKTSIEEIRENMGKVNFYLGIIVSGAKKYHGDIDKKSRCFRNNSKQFTYTCEQYHDNQNEDQFTKMTKIGKQKWIQVLLQSSIKQEVTYFELDITKSKSNYVCIGICSKNCIDQQDSKWSKQAITLFLLDNSIIVQGKQTQNKIYQQKQINKNYSSVSSKIKNNKQSNVNKILVVINCFNKSIQWYSNQNLVGKAHFSQSFNTLCKKGQARPLIICADENDQILIK